MKEKVMEILDEARYELADGINIPGYMRRFTHEEWECIHGVVRFIEQKLEKGLKDNG